MSRWEILKANSWQCLIAVDQLIHTIVGTVIAILSLVRIVPYKVQVWYADETLSSHCWRWSLVGKFVWLQQMVDMLFFWEDNHCKGSYESERLRLQAPPELRNL